MNKVFKGGKLTKLQRIVFGFLYIALTLTWLRIVNDIYYIPDALWKSEVIFVLGFIKWYILYWVMFNHKAGL